MQTAYPRFLVLVSLTEFLESVGPIPRIYEGEPSQSQLEASALTQGRTGPTWIGEIYTKVALS